MRRRQTCRPTTTDKSLLVLSFEEELLPTPIALQTAFDQGAQSGFATIYIQIEDPDGTAPTLQIEQGQQAIVSVVQPTANPGNDKYAIRAKNSLLT